jgi:hypothetical protein
MNKRLLFYHSALPAVPVVQQNSLKPLKTLDFLFNRFFAGQAVGETVTH